MYNNKNIQVTPQDLFSINFRDNLFVYDKTEIEDFTTVCPVSKQNELFKCISDSIKFNPSLVTEMNKFLKKRIDNITDMIKTLTVNDLKDIENYVREYIESSPKMLWNMLHKEDKKLYKNQHKLHDWLSTLSDSMFDKYVCRAAEGLKLHSEYVYKPAEKGTTVEILDGYIAISSANLKALNKVKDRMLANNNCEYEHRVKKHGKVVIHSYVFNMNKQDSN